MTVLLKKNNFSSASTNGILTGLCLFYSLFISVLVNSTLGKILLNAHTLYIYIYIYIYIIYIFTHTYIFIYIYIYIYREREREREKERRSISSEMVTVVGNEYSQPNSNPGQD